jgi:hypothetical protein
LSDDPAEPVSDDGHIDLSLASNAVPSELGVSVSSSVSTDEDAAHKVGDDGREVDGAPSSLSVGSSPPPDEEAAPDADADVGSSVFSSRSTADPVGEHGEVEGSSPVVEAEEEPGPPPPLSLIESAPGGVGGSDRILSVDPDEPASVDGEIDNPPPSDAVSVSRDEDAVPAVGADGVLSGSSVASSPTHDEEAADTEAGSSVGSSPSHVDTSGEPGAVGGASSFIEEEEEPE